MEPISYAYEGNFYLRRFDWAMKRIKVPLAKMPMLAQEGELWVASLLAEVRLEFSNLIVMMPYIGKKNIWKRKLILATVCLSFYNVLKDRGWSTEKIGGLIHTIAELFCKSLPAWLRKTAGRMRFSSARLRKLLEGAVYSQLRRYDEDWVFKVVPGNSRFDFGVDIYRCAIHTFYRSQGAEDLVPYICRLDHLLGNSFGYKIKRKNEIHQGAHYCDCRFTSIG